MKNIRAFVALTIVSLMAMSPLAQARSAHSSQHGIIHHIVKHVVHTGAKVAVVAGGVVAGEYIYHKLTDEPTNTDDSATESDESVSDHESHHESSSSSDDRDDDEDTSMGHGVYRYGLTGP